MSSFDNENKFNLMQQQRLKREQQLCGFPNLTSVFWTTQTKPLLGGPMRGRCWPGNFSSFIVQPQAGAGLVVLAQFGSLHRAGRLCILADSMLLQIARHMPFAPGDHARRITDQHSGVSRWPVDFAKSGSASPCLAWYRPGSYRLELAALDLTGCRLDWAG